MILKLEISVGDILTTISIVVSVIALLISWQRNRELKRKEYADRIRHAASTATIKIQRWRELTLRFFEDIQPLITEADIELVKNKNTNSVRDIFWQRISNIRAVSSQRIIDEQIETAYLDLYGFDPRVQALFAEVINRLKVIDKSIYAQVLYSTQADILSFRPQSEEISSSQLGNKLRNTCYILAGECQVLMDETIEPFSKEMIRMIEQSDIQIVTKRFHMSSVTALFPTNINKLQERLDENTHQNLSQTAILTLLAHAPKGIDSSLLKYISGISDKDALATLQELSKHRIEDIGAIAADRVDIPYMMDEVHRATYSEKLLDLVSMKEKKQINQKARAKRKQRK